jgi:hypothetical protein
VLVFSGKWRPGLLVADKKRRGGKNKGIVKYRWVVERGTRCPTSRGGARGTRKCAET